jgi:hypothetical protein
MLAVDNLASSGLDHCSRPCRKHYFIRSFDHDIICLKGCFYEFLQPAAAPAGRSSRGWKIPRSNNAYMAVHHEDRKHFQHCDKTLRSYHQQKKNQNLPIHSQRIESKPGRKTQSKLSAHKSGITCKKIFYLCACGHYTLRSTRAPCSEALSDNVSSSSTTAFDITKDLRPSTDIQDGQDMISLVWTPWDVDACPTLECLYRKGDPYWKGRWCEECRGRGRRARHRLIKEYGLMEKG